MVTGKARGSALSEDAAGVQLCLIGQSGNAVLHRMSAHTDSASAMQDMLAILEVWLPAWVKDNLPPPQLISFSAPSSLSLSLSLSAPRIPLIFCFSFLTFLPENAFAVSNVLRSANYELGCGSSCSHENVFSGCKKHC